MLSVMDVRGDIRRNAYINSNAPEWNGGAEAKMLNVSRVKRTVGLSDILV